MPHIYSRIFFPLVSLPSEYHVASDHSKILHSIASLVSAVGGNV